jgi:hypothetical protein
MTLLSHGYVFHVKDEREESLTCIKGGNSRGAAEDVNAQYAGYEFHYVSRMMGDTLLML